MKRGPLRVDDGGKKVLRDRQKVVAERRKREAYTFQNGEPVTKSGRQEMLENLINEFL